MKKYKGSFTVEAACVFPLVLLSICIAIGSGMSLHEEVLLRTAKQENGVWVDMVECMYRRELIKDIFGEWYED